MHKQCTPWYTGGSILWKGGNKGYFCSTSIAVGVIISKCTKWDLFMFWRSVDIQGQLGHVLIATWSIPTQTLVQTHSLPHFRKMKNGVNCYFFGDNVTTTLICGCVNFWMPTQSTDCMPLPLTPSTLHYKVSSAVSSEDLAGYCTCAIKIKRM